MKRIIVLVSLLFLGLYTFAQAKMTFTETEHNFGAIAYNSDGTVVFEYTNSGDKPLIILSVDTSCGCTTPTYTKEPLMPGQTGQITVEYDTTREGVFNKTITITSTAANSPVMLSISGEVEMIQAKDQTKTLN
jgi:hypothetical protein